jgi:tetratricopeptide (TPR) repeat protein
MPSYLDFNSTKKFRDYILGKTLNVPNGPQTFSNASFSVDKLSDMSNKDTGDVVLNDSTSRKTQVDNISNLNVNQPSDSYLIVEDLNTVLIRNLMNPYIQEICMLLEKDFDANKDNLDWIKRTANRLSNKGCTDSPFFSKLLDQYEKLTPPTFGTLYNKGISLIKSDKAKAKEYFMKALDMAPDNNKKADLYFTIATQIYGMGNKATAKSYCDKALGLKPSLDKAHMYIAQLYAASLNEVGLTDAFDKRAIYWLAAQTARKGGTAAANSLAAKYEAAAPNKQEIFQSGKAGQQICFKGWIGKCITVPNL